jgi:hypothetical protein
MTPDDLERVVGASLRALPAPRAPRTLLPGVLAAAAARTRPWYSRAWRTWPEPLQAATTAAAACLLAVGTALVTGLVPLDTLLALANITPPAWLAGASEAVVATAALVRSLRRVFLEPAIASVILLAIVVSLTCVAFRAAAARLALGGASQS